MVDGIADLTVTVKLVTIVPVATDTTAGFPIGCHVHRPERVVAGIQIPEDLRAGTLVGALAPGRTAKCGGENQYQNDSYYFHKILQQRIWCYEAKHKLKPLASTFATRNGHLTGFDQTGQLIKALCQAVFSGSTMKIYPHDLRKTVFFRAG